MKSAGSFATINPCRQCAPLGAAIAFAGVRGAVCVLHGSQGCSTYIRRYLGSHYGEPVDVASSGFTESSAIFGGEDNLRRAVANVCSQYRPQLIGIATTCLAETIGEDVKRFVARIRTDPPADVKLVHASTPGFSGTQADGYRSAVTALVGLVGECAAADPRGSMPSGKVALFPPIVSPADLRALIEAVRECGLSPVTVPDYSDTLDGPPWTEYRPIPEGGTPWEDIRDLPDCELAVTLGDVEALCDGPGSYLNRRLSLRHETSGLPIGLGRTDAFFAFLKSVSGRPFPKRLAGQRGRLADAYLDGHKHVFELPVCVYGDDDLVVALAVFLREIGAIPVVCAGSGATGYFGRALRDAVPDLESLGARVTEGEDFDALEREIKSMTEKPRLMLGNGMGARTAERFGIPLVRIGFPIHDRFGGGRVRSLLYEGTLELFDRIVNAEIQRRESGGERRRHA